MIQRVLSYLGLKKSVVSLLFMVICVGMGEKLAERFLPKFIEVTSGSILAVGLLNALDNFLSAIYSLPGGFLSDMLGYKRALIVFNIIAMIGYLIVIIFPTWYAALIGALFFISWDALSLPATMSLISKVLPQTKHTMGVTMHSLIRRIPMALGPIIGGWLINLYGIINGVRLAFGFALAMAFISLVLQQVMMEDDKNIKSAKEVSAPWNTLFSKQLKNLLISDILVRFCEQIPYAFIVLWCLGDDVTGIKPKITALDFGILTAIEMVAAVLIYIPVAHFADKGYKKPIVAITFVFFSLFPITLYFSHTFWMLVIAFIIRGFKEFGEPTRKAMILELVPKEHTAYTYGVYYLIRDVVVSVSVLFGAYLWKVSPALNLFVAFSFGILSVIYFILSDVSIKTNEKIS